MKTDAQTEIQVGGWPKSLLAVAAALIWWASVVAFILSEGFLRLALPWMAILYLFPFVSLLAVVCLLREDRLRREHGFIYYTVTIFAVTPIAIFVGGLLPSFINTLVSILTG